MSSLLAALQNKKKELDAKRGRAKTDKLPGGASRWRVLPHWKGKDEMPSQDYGAHFIKNKMDEIVAVYICTAKTFGRECEVCNQLGAAIAATSDPMEKKLLEGAKSAQRYLLNAVRFNPTSKKYDDNVSLLEVSGPVINGIIAVATSYAESDQIDLFSLSEGFDVVINKEGTGLQTKYNVMAAPKATAISVEYMKKVHNLDEYVAQEHEAGLARALGALKGGTVQNVLPSSVSKNVPVSTPSTAVLAAPSAGEVEDALGDLDLSDVDLDALEQVS
jgi:hypothetical protein